ncbi:MAG: hypothetical protein ABI999_06555 [Acidobacteriota bacterium]
MTEVWEKLDCENVGAKEIIAIETVIRDVFGEAAVDSPMTIARLLADEGAELRHSEIMKLWLERNQETVYAGVLRNILKLDSFERALTTIADLDRARNTFLSDEDKTGIRLVRETALRGKQELKAAAEKTRTPETAARNLEIAEWLTLWLQSPGVFDNWVRLRLRSKDFIAKFGQL